MRGKKESPQVVPDVGADEEVREEPCLLMIEPIAVPYKDTIERMARGLPFKKVQLLADELAGRLGEQSDQLKNVQGWVKWKVAHLFEPSPAAVAIAKARERRRFNEAAVMSRKAATAPPDDDEAKKKGATLLQKIAPSFASHIKQL